MFLLLKVMLYLYKITVNYLLSPFFNCIYSSISGHFFYFFVFLTYNNVYPKYCQIDKKGDNQGT